METAVDHIFHNPGKLLAAAFLLLLGLVSPASPADKPFVFRTASQSTYSTTLGVVTIPAYAVVENARYQGLFIMSKPAADLGRKMNLAPGMVLVSIDGCSMNTSQIADNWLASRSQNKPIQYTCVMNQGGQPKICQGQVLASPGSQTKEASAPVTRGSSQDSSDELKSYYLSLINNSRKSEGKTAIHTDSALSRLAQQYADYMAEHPVEYDPTSNRSPHMDLQGRMPGDRARLAGIPNLLSENVGTGARGGVRGDREVIATLHELMMAEPPGVPNHRSDILDSRCTCVGIGIARSSNRIYLSQEFGY